MFKGLRQLLLGDRRANKRACRQPARGSRKPESFRWCAPALGEPRRPAAGSRGARTGKLAPQGGERRPPGLPTLGRVGSMTVRPQPPPLPIGTPIQLAASPKPLRVCRRLVSLSPAHFPLSSQPGSPHSSAAQPPDFVLLWRRFWRRLTTLNAHRCGVSVGDAWERVTKLYKRPAQSEVPVRRAPLYQELASHVKKNLQPRLQVRKVNATAAC